MGAIKPSILLFNLLLPFASSALADSSPLANANATIALDSSTIAFPPLASGYYNEHQVVSHLASRLQTCINQVPSEHGLFFHIEDLSEEPVSSYAEGQGPGLNRRGMLRSVHKGWNDMPFDQRLGVISTVAGTAAVPMYLLGAGIGFNEYEIGNLKDRLVSKPGNQTRHRSKSFTLPPPPPYAGPAKRSWTETVQDILPLVKRSPLVKTAHPPKVPNEKVARVMGMVNAGNAILYLSTALVSAVRIMTVRPSDTTVYKRSVLPEIKGFTVTCIPVEKISEMDYKIPMGGLSEGKQDSNQAGQLKYVDPNAMSGTPVPAEERAADEVKTADLSNGHHRVLVKRAVIPLREEGISTHDAPSHEKSASDASSHKEGHTGGHLQDNQEAPLVRRNGEPVHVEKIKHIYHVDHSLAKHPSGGQPAPVHPDQQPVPAKKKSNTGKAIAYAAGGLAAGYGAHMWYQSSLQQQQAAAVAAAAQAQVYGADDSDYEYASPPGAKRGLEWVDDYMVKRSFDQEDDIASTLARRSPVNEKPKPHIVIVKHVVHHNNVHPDHAPGGARYHEMHPNGGHGGTHPKNGEGKPGPEEGGPEKGEPKKGDPEKGDPEVKVVYVTHGEGKGKGEPEHPGERQGEVEAAQKKKKMGALTKVALVTGGAMAGAWAHAAMSPSAPPPPPPSQLQGYYDGGTGGIPVPAYRKREIFSGLKKRSQMPLSINRGFASGEGTFRYSPDYLDYYSRPAKRDLVKRKHDSYGDYVNALKQVYDTDEEGGMAAVAPKAVTAKAVTHVVTTPAKRDTVKYDFDGNNVHFAAQSSKQSAVDDGEEDSLRKRESNITFDTDEKNGVHFKATSPPLASSLTPAKSAAAGSGSRLELDDELERRSAPVYLSYEHEPNGGQYFSASTNGKAAQDEEDETVLRRRELSKITYDHSKDGSHFVATIGESEAKEEKSADLKELEAMLERRDHDHHHDIDYKTNKDNEVTFHASSPYTPSEEGDAGNSKEKGITIHIVPRSEGMSRRRVVADR